MTSKTLLDLVELDSLPQSWEVRMLEDVASINQETTNLKNYSWIHYTDISSVGTRTVEIPSKLETKDAPSRARRVLRKGDTVISSVRPNRRSFFYFNEEWTNAIASTGFAVLSPKNFDDAEYLHAVLTSENAVKIYEAICEGGAYPAFNPSRLNEIRIPWPPHSVRRELGHVVMNLQSKIALNNALSKTLEEIAQAIFKSWFIDFEPVKAKMAGERPVGMDAATAALFPDSMEESKLGLIPKGWKVSNLDSLSLVRYGAPFASKHFNTTKVGLPLIRIRDLKKQAISTWSPEKLAKGFLVSGGELLVGMDGEFNPTIWFGEDALVNQRICKIEPKDFVSNFFLYFALLPIMRRIEHGSTGSTVIHLRKTDIDAIRILEPSQKILAEYKSKVEPMLRNIVSLNIQTRILQEARDALLPRLISGELQIPKEMMAS